jgi:predicted amidohydrolase
MVSLLRPGDIYCHVYQGRGNTILDGNKVRQAIHRARQEGLVFDTADGKPHYAFSVAKTALADGFEPDIISSDIVRGTMFEHTVFGLPLIMSKYLNLGMSLENIVKACTATPARLLGLEGHIGTLAAGAEADVAVFKLEEFSMTLQDVFGDVLTCGSVLVPQLTILDGRIVYRNIKF